MLSLLVLAACQERTPEFFQDITGVYFNNMSATMSVTDTLKERARGDIRLLNLQRDGSRRFLRISLRRFIRRERTVRTVRLGGDLICGIGRRRRCRRAADAASRQRGSKRQKACRKPCMFALFHDSVLLAPSSLCA